MPYDHFDTRQSIFRPAAPGFGTAANTELDVLLLAINSIFTAGSAGQLFVSNGGAAPAFSSTVGANITFSDTIGVGTGFITGQAITTSISGTNTSLTGVSVVVDSMLSSVTAFNQSGTQITMEGVQSANNASFLVGLRSQFTSAISSGITNSGAWEALQANGVRQGGSGDLGTLAQILSINSQYGNLSTGSSAITTDAYGVYVTPYWTTGTVSTAYGVYIADAETGGTGPTTGGIGSIGNYYGIYQEDANAQNFFNGIIRLGSTAAPGSGNRPLSVNGSNQVVAGVNTYTAPTVQRFLSGSGTYTTPSNVLYLKVKIVGGGGGGAGSGSLGTGGGGGTAGSTSFENASQSFELLASGGNGGGGNAGAGGTGGVAVITPGSATFYTIAALQGGSGGGGNYGGNGTGGSGASSPFGGGGGGGNGVGSSVGTSGQNAIVNTGAGGGGSGYGGGSNGGGGGAGGYVEAIINSPLASYTYTVGTDGIGGTPGSGSGSGGGNGASGMIIVEEYYQ